MIIILDSGILSALTRKPATADLLDLHKWYQDCKNASHRFLVPEIADYEVRRELIRANKVHSIQRLDSFIAGIEIPITSKALKYAAELWANARNQRIATASYETLDADVILAAQVITSGESMADIIVATTNVRHLGRYVRADNWQNIQP